MPNTEFEGEEILADYLTFEKRSDKLVVVITSIQDGSDGLSYIDEELEIGNSVSFLYKVFTFEAQDYIQSESRGIHVKKFVLGIKGDYGYYEIPKRILGLAADCLIHESVEITREMFVPRRTRMNALKKIERMSVPGLIIGGNGEYGSCIDGDLFIKMVKAFPTSTEVKLYVEDRINTIIADSLPVTIDSSKRYREYLNRVDESRQMIHGVPEETRLIRAGEVEKLRVLLNKLESMLADCSQASEKMWEQKLLDFILLLFPKYIAVLHSVNFVVEKVKRQIDLMLVDADGNVDILELKKPKDGQLLSFGLHRKNYMPASELSAAVMQVEKYLYLLKRGGAMLESRLNEKYRSTLPPGVSIKIANPKALILLGRSNGFDEKQRLDYEVIKRKYLNIMDIISYDDLINRLRNTLRALER